MQPEAFRAKLKSYLRLVGQSQKALAAELGLHADVLSHKLNGISNSHLTHAEVRQITLILARWLAFTTQAEVIELLSYIDMGRSTSAKPNGSNLHLVDSYLHLHHQKPSPAALLHLPQLYRRR